MKWRMAILLLAACVAVVMFSCRRNLPTLIDANRPPDTELWYVPLDSTEYEWNVHLYWRGIDLDGVVVAYIWTITDTVEANPLLRWNPAERGSDLKKGIVTTRTDSVIAFKAYTTVGGVGIKKNRQAFHIAAIDDNGVIDPTPAVIEFVATVGKLPTIRFHTTITSWNPKTGRFERKGPKLYDPYAPPDTVGMFRPFSISYRGFTTNGVVTHYKYRPLTSGILIKGQDQWCSATDPCPYDDPKLAEKDPCCPTPDWGRNHPDTLRYFPNGSDPSIKGSELPSDMFRLAVQCRDVSGAESFVDGTNYTEGVVQIVVNYEPDTQIDAVENLVYLEPEKGPSYTELVNFTDDVPDTVPYDSWVRIDYHGWDDARDSSLCDLKPPQDRIRDECLGYQIRFTRKRGTTWNSPWYPFGALQVSQKAVPDSNSKNIGTWDYTFQVRTVDEYGRPDETPAGINPLTGKPRAEVKIVGNFEPTLDMAAVTNYDGTAATRDTTVLVWDWWHPANSDTLEFVNGKWYEKRIFYLDIDAAGHDHPKENARFGIVNWRYNVVRADNLEPELFFGGQGAWRESPKNVFHQRFEVQYRYEQSDSTIGGKHIWERPPQFWNRLYEFSIEGRDIGEGEVFTDYLVFHDQTIPYNPQGRGVKQRLNSSIASEAAQRTELRKFWFMLKVVR